MTHQPPSVAGPDRPPEWRWRLTVLGVAALVLVALRLHGWSQPLEADTATYLLVARTWQQGGLPYVDVWDHKPIGAYALYRFGLLLGGYGEGTVRMLSLVAMMLALATLAWVLWREARWFYAAGVAAWPFLAVLVPCQANEDDLEVLLLPVLFAAGGLLRRYSENGRLRCWVGAVAVLVGSLLVKPVTLPFLAVAGLWLVVRERPRWGRIAGIGLVTVVVGVAVYFAAYVVAGVPGASLAQFADNARYLATPAAGHESWLRRVLAVAATFIWAPPLRTIWPLTVVGLAGLLLVRRYSTAWCLGLLLYAASVLAVAMLGRGAAHYYILLLPAVLLSFLWAGARLARRWPVGGRLVAAAAAVYLAGLAVGDYLVSPPEHLSIQNYGPWFVQDRRIGCWLKAKGVAGHRIYVDSTHPSIYVYAEARPALRYFTSMWLHQGQVSAAEMMADLRAQPPDFLVLLRPEAEDDHAPSPELAPLILPGFGEWRRANYTWFGIAYDARVYCRRQPGAPVTRPE